jgi:hypothetical protein
LAPVGYTAFYCDAIRYLRDQNIQVLNKAGSLCEENAEWRDSAPTKRLIISRNSKWCTRERAPTSYKGHSKSKKYKKFTTRYISMFYVDMSEEKTFL